MKDDTVFCKIVQGQRYVKESVPPAGGFLLVQKVTKDTVKGGAIRDPFGPSGDRMGKEAQRNGRGLTFHRKVGMRDMEFVPTQTPLP